MDFGLSTSMIPIMLQNPDAAASMLALKGTPPVIPGANSSFQWPDMSGALSVPGITPGTPGAPGTPGMPAATPQTPGDKFAQALGLMGQAIKAPAAPEAVKPGTPAARQPTAGVSPNLQLLMQVLQQGGAAATLGGALTGRR